VTGLSDDNKMDYFGSGNYLNLRCSFMSRSARQEALCVMSVIKIRETHSSPSVDQNLRITASAETETR
jgi:hypothetical protein